MLAIPKQPFSYTHNVINQPKAARHTAHQKKSLRRVAGITKEANSVRIPPFTAFPTRKLFLEFFYYSNFSGNGRKSPRGDLTSHFI
jgi:hypothetical protein